MSLGTASRATVTIGSQAQERPAAAAEEAEAAVARSRSPARPTSSGPSRKTLRPWIKQTTNLPACGATVRRCGCPRRRAGSSPTTWPAASACPNSSSGWTRTTAPPRGIWSDGITAWVADSDRDTLFAYALHGGERQKASDIVLDEDNPSPRGIWSDGETMWVLDGSAASLLAYDPGTGELSAGHPLAAVNDDPRGIWSDGVSIWVSDGEVGRVFAYRLPKTGESEPLTRDRDLDFTGLSRAGNSSPRGIWSDGALLYVADAGTDRVFTYNMPDAIDPRLAALELTGVDIGDFDPATTAYVGPDRRRGDHHHRHRPPGPTRRQRGNLPARRRPADRRPPGGTGRHRRDNR